MVQEIQLFDKLSPYAGLTAPLLEKMISMCHSPVHAREQESPKRCGVPVVLALPVCETFEPEAAEVTEPAGLSEDGGQAPFSDQGRRAGPRIASDKYPENSWIPDTP